MKDHYEVGDLLGRGGMGQVHVARHRAGHLVAIKRVRKTLASDRLITDGLATEARLLRRVAHPNVVRALDSGQDDDGSPFLVMDRAHGMPLDTLLGTRDHLSLARVAHISRQILSGLGAIHAAGVVHADVKSSNVMIDDEDHVVIIDFGLARTMSRLDVGMIAGTPSYIAPEVIGGESPTVAADIYAVGAIVYEMLTGTLPFHGPRALVMLRQMSDVIEPPSKRSPDRNLSSDIDTVVMRALARDPAQRYATIEDMALALGQALDAATDAEALPELIELTATRDFWDRATLPRERRAVDPIVEAEPTRRVVDVEGMISSALERVRGLLDAKKLDDAIAVIEIALVEVRNAEDGETPASVWRMESVLAALYQHCGRTEAAGRVARLAFMHAHRSGNEGAKLRTRELLERLSRKPRDRVARGSKPIATRAAKPAK